MGYKGPNEIYENVPEMVRTLIYVVQSSHLENEIMTHGSLYNFAMLDSPEIGHLRKTIISPNW